MNQSDIRTVEQLEEKIIKAAEIGGAIEVQGRAYYVIDDISHLKLMMNGLIDKI